jgi:serine/threonine protein kinase
MAISTATFVDTVRQNQLLSPTQLDELSRHFKPGSTDPRALAKDLCARGWLTPYQVEQLLSGNGNALVLGPYVLLQWLGEGGMGQVFKARHCKLGRTVALKVIRKENVVDAESVGRFQREMQVTSRLEHPNVVRALDAGPLGGTLALIMEYVEGTDLDRLVKERGPLPVAEACDVLRQAAQGLQHIHEHGLIHRDIKPSNLMVATDNRGSARGPVVKILDLGLARLQDGCHGKKTTHLGDGKSLTTLTLDGAAGTLGSIDYLSPEQALDVHRVDIRGDIYSLGCTFFYMLTGRPPFGSGSLAIKLMRHQQAEPPDLQLLRPETASALCDILRKMLAKQAGDRYQSPADLLEALGSATGPRAGSANRRVHAAGRRRRWAVVGLLLLTAVLFGFLWLPGRFSASSAPTPSDQAASSNSTGAEAKVVPGNVALAKAGATVSGPGVTVEMIDGVTAGYTGYRGFTQGVWPCSWTVTLPHTYLLQEIRLLLWDGNRRHYRYTIETSLDGKSFGPLVDHSTGEWRSWQTISFAPRPVKYIKVQGLYNSDNKWFHIVELEAYCIPPDRPAAPRYPSVATPPTGSTTSSKPVSTASVR